MAKNKGWIILFVVLGLFVLLGAMFILGIRAALQDKPIVKKDSVLKIELAGLISEHYSQDPIGREFEGANLQMHDLYKALKMAKLDDRIRGVYLRVSNPDIGWAKAQEIKNALNEFKEDGKFIIAFMPFCNEKSYYIALSADAIYLQPHSFAEFNGFASEIPFYKRMINKLGMQAQVASVGKYKSAGDIYDRDSMSPAHREATEALLNDVYEEFVQSVCERRSIERAKLEAALNKGIYHSEDALEMRLVDELTYETAVLDEIKAKVYGEEASNDQNRELRTISVNRYAKISAKDVGLGKGDKIALIYAIGTIVPGGSGHDPLFGRNMGSQSVVSMFRSVGKNKSMKAVVLRVDSPGGFGIASDEIWAEIEKVRKKKPVVVSMSDVAASGGYWISMGCDAIVAQPMTITGSIGVVSALFDLSGTYDKVGIVWETVKKGDHADMPTDKRPLTEEEWEIFKKLNHDFYQVFVQKVADGRGKTWDEIHKIAQGRVWTGKRALQFGLVDSLGGLEAALAIAKEKAGLDAEAPTQWVVYPQPKGLFASILQKFSVRLVKLFGPRIQEWAVIQNLPAETKSLLRQISVLRRLRHGEVMAIAPYVPVIK
ncbi:MAG: signal peptide peptidase SppA [bacterium]